MTKTASEWVDYIMATRQEHDEGRAAKCVAYALDMWGDQLVLPLVRAANRRAEAAEKRADEEFRTADDGFHATFKQIQRCQEAGHVKGGGCCGPCLLKATRAWRFATAADPSLRHVEGNAAQPPPEAVSAASADSRALLEARKLLQLALDHLHETHSCSSDVPQEIAAFLGGSNVVDAPTKEK